MTFVQPTNITFSATTCVTDASGLCSITATSTTAGNYTSAVSISDGTLSDSPASFGFVADAADATISTVTTTADGALADGSTTNTLQATIKDANGNAVAGETVTFVQPTNITFSATTCVTDASGLCSITATSTTAGNYTSAVSISDGTLSDSPASFGFVADAVDARTSSVSATPTSVVADGTTSTVTVTVLDANDNPLLGSTVTLAQGAGSSTIGDVTNNGDGTYTFIVSFTTAEVVTYTATADGVTITDTEMVTFIPKNQTIGAITPTMSVTFGDADFMVSATATSGLAVTFGSTSPAVCTASPTGVVTLTGTGICKLTADQVGNSNYNAATPQVTASITVNQHPGVIAVIEDIAGNADGTPATAAEINSIPSVSGAVNGTDYVAALAAGTYADSANPTATEIQTVVDTENARLAGIAAALAEIIEDIAGNANGTPATAAQINMVLGSSKAVTGTDYTAALAAGTYVDSTTPTAAEIQTVIDAENANISAALNAVIEDIAGNADGIPVTAEQINLIAGVADAVTGRDYTLALAAGTYANPATPTAAEIQTVIDAENAKFTGGGGAASLNWLVLLGLIALLRRRRISI